MLSHKPTDLGRAHHIPAPIRPYHNKLVSFFQVQVLDFRFRNEPNLLPLKIPQRPRHSDTRPFLIRPHSRRPHLHSIMCQPIYFPTQFLYSFSFIAPRWLVIIRQFYSQSLLSCDSEHHSSGIPQIGNINLAILDVYGNRAGSRIRIIDTA